MPNDRLDNRLEGIAQVASATLLLAFGAILMMIPARLTVCALLADAPWALTAGLAWLLGAGLGSYAAARRAGRPLLHMTLAAPPLAVAGFTLVTWRGFDIPISLDVVLIAVVAAWAGAVLGARVAAARPGRSTRASRNLVVGAVATVVIVFVAVGLLMGALMADFASIIGW